VLGAYVRKYDALYCDTDSIATYKKIPTSEKLGDFKLEARGNAMFIRPKLYFIFDKENNVTKYAKHGLRIQKPKKDPLSKGQYIFNFLKDQGKQSKIHYNIDRITRYKESIARELDFLTCKNQHFTLALKADTRRQYIHQFKTFDEMLTNNTDSLPLLTASIK
jgi:hypothetical protein